MRMSFASLADKPRRASGFALPDMFSGTGVQWKEVENGGGVAVQKCLGNEDKGGETIKRARDWACGIEQIL